MAYRYKNISIRREIMGAIFDTYQIIKDVLSYFSNRNPDVKVKLHYGRPETPSTPSHLNDQIELEAINNGKFPVTLESYGLILPNKRRYEFERNWPASATFPFLLGRGQDCRIYCYVGKISQYIKLQGYIGKVNIRGFFVDSYGKVYASNVYEFDNGSWKIRGWLSSLIYIIKFDINLPKFKL